MFERSKVEVNPVVRAKWPEAVANEGYVPLPKRLLRCMRELFHGASALQELTVLLAIVDYRRPRMSRPPSIEFLAFTAGMPLDEFRKHVDVMRERGWIEVSGTDADYQVALDGFMAEVLTNAPDEV